MGEKKLEDTFSAEGLPRFLTPKQFKKHIADWSDEVLREEATHNGMPHIIRDNGRYLYPTREVLLWFKRRFQGAR